MLSSKSLAILLVFFVACVVPGKEVASKEVALQPRVSTISPSENVQYELQSRLIDAIPGDVIQLEEGVYRLKRQLDVVTDNLTIRGAGSGKTILTFQGQDSGSAGLEATGDHLLLEGFAVEDTAGNAIKVLGANHVTFRDVRTEWTGPAKTTNGAYGLYPVQCENVLVEHCVAIGASDAGIYVGQCRNVIVRHNRAERNVAGIEIENSVHADVYENTSTNNTGGLLVFDLPGLQLKNGRNIRVYKNKINSNNHENFAAKGSIVSTVPAGMGIMILVTDEVEIFENDITDHRTSGISILHFGITGTKLKDDSFDQYPESISIHDNRFKQTGYNPTGGMTALLKPVLGAKFPEVLWDGSVNPKRTQDGKATDQQRPSLKNNGEISFANINFALLSPQNLLLGKYKVDRDLAGYAGVRKRLASTKLESATPPVASEFSAVHVYRTARQRLSEYGLFAGELANQQPAEDVVPYALNTPLFSDHTSKYRFIQVPEGKQIEYRDKGVMQFPVGTVIAKTFSYPHDMTDLSKGERLLETRIELRREDNWYGFSYLWNDEQTEATLALGGAEVDVSWIHTDGERRENSYQVPNANQCITCHQTGDKFVPIGPVAANMHDDFEYAHGSENQLQLLQRQKMLVGLPDLKKLPAWPQYDDFTDSAEQLPASDVNDHARTWLHVNCAHCHNPEGTARTSGLDLRRSQQDLAKLGVWKTPVAAGHGTGGHSYDIVPGKPEESILLHRMQSTDPSVTMPNVAKRMVSDKAVELVTAWVKQLPPTK